MEEGSVLGKNTNPSKPARRTGREGSSPTHEYSEAYTGLCTAALDGHVRHLTAQLLLHSCRQLVLCGILGNQHRAVGPLLLGCYQAALADVCGSTVSLVLIIIIQFINYNSNELLFIILLWDCFEGRFSRPGARLNVAWE